MKIKFTLYAILLVILSGVSTQHAQAPNTTTELRTDVGIYYDYLVIETSDGNEWLLDETDEIVPYVEGGRYLIIFDTMGTDDVTDDVIVDMQYID